MAVPFIKTSFAAGEVAPSFFGHVDNAHYAIGCSTCRNAFISYLGGAYSRAGTKFVGFSKQTGRSYPPRLITFQFSILQGLCLEFGHQYLRIVQNGAFVTETPITITAISQANPAVVSAVNSYANGDWVNIVAAGMSAVNGQIYIVAARTGTTFQLTDVYGNPVNSSAYSAFVSGTAARIYTLTTPYNEVDLPYLKWAQSADVMSICCWNQQTGTLYQARDLRRITNNNWTLTVTSFAPTIAPPGQPTLVATHPAGQLGATDTSAATYGYEITAVSLGDGSESIASTPASVQSANIAVTSGSIKVSWAGSSGAASYNIYKAQPIAGTTTTPPANVIPAGVLYGFAGTSIGTSFTDTNILQDFSQVPPTHTNPFAAGAIIGVTLTGNGSGGTSQPTITITTSTGSGAVLQAVFDPDAGTVTGVVIADGGQIYSPADTITFSGGGFSVQATGTLVVGPGSGTDPSVVTYFQQRRVYAATPNRPDTYFMSQPGAFTNFDRRIPTIDSDAIVGTPWSLQVNGIQFMVQMPAGLISLTGVGAWQISGSGSSAYAIQPITPANQTAVPQAYNGCHTNIPPIKIDNEVYYVQAKGSRVRDLSYNFFTNIYTGVDTTYLSSHLFQANTGADTGGIIAEWCWNEEPYKLIWVARQDGTFLSFTTLKAQEVAAWTRHDTLGSVRSLTSVTEPPVDALYLAVERFPGPHDAFMIERMDDRLWAGVENVWAVDSGLALVPDTPAATCAPIGGSGTNVRILSFPDAFVPGMVGQILRVGGGVATITAYVSGGEIRVDFTTPIALVQPNNGGPIRQPAGNWSIAPLVSQIGGLNHLLGLTVTGIADGVPITPRLVQVLSNGEVGITLDDQASAVTVGLGFQVQVQSLYLDAGQPTIQGRRKKIAAATVRIEASAGIKCGANQPDGSVQSPAQLAPTWANLSVVPDKGPTYPTAGGAAVTELFTGDIRVPLSGGWDTRGQVAVQQDNPLPLNILAFVPETLPGDSPEEQASPRRENGRRA